MIRSLLLVLLAGILMTEAGCAGGTMPSYGDTRICGEAAKRDCPPARRFSAGDRGR